MRRLLIALFCGFMLAGTAIADSGADFLPGSTAEVKPWMQKWNRYLVAGDGVIYGAGNDTEGWATTSPPSAKWVKVPTAKRTPRDPSWATVLTEDDCVKLAQADEKPVVLTPTKLYDLIESLEVALTKSNQDQEIMKMQIHDLEVALTKSNQDQEIMKMQIHDLERKVKGMQKQITILHAIVKPLKK